MPLPRADARSLRSIIEGATSRWATVLGAAEDGQRPVPKLEWSVGELSAHMVSVVESFDRYLREDSRPPVSYSRLDAFNQDRIAKIVEREPRALTERLVRAVRSFLGTTEWMEPEDPFPWFDGYTIDMTAAYGLLAGELLVHGRDLSAALDLSWPIPAPEARQAMVAMLPAAPASLDPDAAAGLNARIRVRLWGGPRFGFLIEGGRATVTDGTDPADVTLWAHPTEFMLTTYGRKSPLQVAVAGRALAWGRRPWLAFQLPKLFRV